MHMSCLSSGKKNSIFIVRTTATRMQSKIKLGWKSCLNIGRVCWKHFEADSPLWEMSPKCLLSQSKAQGKQLGCAAGSREGISL